MKSRQDIEKKVTDYANASYDDLTLRRVIILATCFAEDVLSIWTSKHPEDTRPAIAIAAAKEGDHYQASRMYRRARWDWEKRTEEQRTASPDELAHDSAIEAALALNSPDKYMATPRAMDAAGNAWEALWNSGRCDDANTLWDRVAERFTKEVLIDDAWWNARKSLMDGWDLNRIDAVWSGSATNGHQWQRLLLLGCAGGGRELVELALTNGANPEKGLPGKRRAFAWKLREGARQKFNVPKTLILRYPLELALASGNEQCASLILPKVPTEHIEQIIKKLEVTPKPTNFWRERAKLTLAEGLVKLGEQHREAGHKLLIATGKWAKRQKLNGGDMWRERKDGLEWWGRKDDLMDMHKRLVRHPWSNYEPPLEYTLSDGVI